MSLVELSRPSEAVWQLTLCSPPDNRLTPELLSSLSDHLDTIEKEWRLSGGGEMDIKKRKTFPSGGAGAVVLTSGLDKFFSNGLDFGKAMKVDHFFEKIFDPVMWRLLTFPLITIAAITGHAFAGGMILALCCDYRVMTSGKGLLCMNEITFSSPLPNSFAAFLRIRIPHTPHLRDTLLGKRWTQPEAKAAGLIDEIVDDLSDSKAVVKRAIEVGLREGPKVAPGPWGMIKAGTYHPVFEASESYRAVLFPHQEAKAFFDRTGKKANKAKL
ncbi:enoyl-CoA hydratase/isomerase [Tremella mesenterica]|uniref:Enoyl-CoA hydratase/isomerase n=1 Tax=Tremella mesenterica TaxID=5217 RepID=A0A4Q1BWS8_TREME|nr:enoyl-CoA hydratase/isomerase [Tremella mesenterica]